MQMNGDAHEIFKKNYQSIYEMFLFVAFTTYVYGLLILFCILACQKSTSVTSGAASYPDCNPCSELRIRINT